VCVGLTLGQDRARGLAVGDVGHAVEVIVVHGDDITVVAAIVVAVVAMTRSIVVAVVVSHHAVVGVMTKMDTPTRRREVAADQPMITAVRREMTNRIRR